MRSPHKGNGEKNVTFFHFRGQLNFMPKKDQGAKVEGKAAETARKKKKKGNGFLKGFFSLPLCS